jgi:hypothetical protein
MPQAFDSLPLADINYFLMYLKRLCAFILTLTYQNTVNIPGRKIRYIYGRKRSNTGRLRIVFYRCERDDSSS